MAGADGNVSKHSWKTELPSSEVAAAAAPPDELWPRKQGGGGGRVSTTLTARYKRASVSGGNKDGNPPLFPPAASLRSLPWEAASDAQILQAREYDGVRA